MTDKGLLAIVAVLLLGLFTVLLIGMDDGSTDAGSMQADILSAASVALQ